MNILKAKEFLEQTISIIDLTQTTEQTMHRKILHIALPSIFTNITVPLLGIVGTYIAAHLGAYYLAAISVGSTLFSTTYSLFNFLRMGTGGVAAQSYGAEQFSESGVVLGRSLVIALSLSLGILLLQQPIIELGLWLMSVEGAQRVLVMDYFHWLIWGAPAMLSLFALNGWLLGMQNAVYPMIVAVTQNLLNIGISLFLVYGLQMKIEGVAIGALTAQWVGAILALTFAVRVARKHGIALFSQGHRVFRDLIAWKRFFTVNVFIFLRTLCLVAVMFSFTAFGNRSGNYVVAGNAILLQLFLLTSYFLDGFAYAGEAVGGRITGQGDGVEFRRLVGALFLWGGIIALLFSAFFFVMGDFIVEQLGQDAQVITVARTYLPYVVALPVVSVTAFLFDGLYIGTTATRSMLVGVAYASALFFLLHQMLAPTMGNHALWIAFTAYLALRGGVMALQLPGVLRRKFG